MVERSAYFEHLRNIRTEQNHKQAALIKSDFLDYLDKTANSSMVFYGVNMRYGEPVLSRGEYVHRWTDRYRRRLLARFYKLDDWFKANPCNTTMMTLTTRHEGFLPDQYALLQTYYRKLKNVMRQPSFLGNFSYFYVLEPHKDGYVHLHMLIFKELTQEHQDRIKGLWANKYGVGVEDALDFEIKTVEGGLKSPKNYLMKYLEKTFKDADNDFNSSFFLFSAVAWYMGQDYNDYKPIRFWNSSRDLQPIMKLDETDLKNDIEWYKVEISTPDNDSVMWQKERPVKVFTDADFL